MHVSQSGYIECNYKRYNDYNNGSVTHILKQYLFKHIPLAKCVYTQANKYPKNMKQYYADLFLLSSLLRLDVGNVPQPKKKRTK